MLSTVQLEDLIDDKRRRQLPGRPIPWSDPAFSKRVLQEHLSQKHDILTRRISLIDRQVNWIHRSLCQNHSNRILDLGCGPGLYCHRLAAWDHHCTGIDISPAAIQYARQQAAAQDLDCDFIEADLLDFEANQEYDIIMLTFGDWNALRRAEAIGLLDKISATLAPNGLLLLEPLTAAGVKAIGQQENRWYSETQGVFSEQPYLCLEECEWDAARKVASVRHYIIGPEKPAIRIFQQNYQAYSQNELADLLSAAGFDSIEYYPGLAETAEDFGDELILTVARRAGSTDSSALASDTSSS